MAYDKVQNNESATPALKAYLIETVLVRDIYIAALHGLLTIAKDVPDEIRNLPIAHQAFRHLIFCKAVDNFQSYIVDILKSIFIKYPHSFFRSKIESEIVFEANDIEDLRDYVIERGVREISYKNMIDVDAYLTKNLGFGLFSSRIQALRIQHILYQRNLVVHNRGRVNDLYKVLTGRKDLAVGSQAKIMDTVRAASYLDAVVSYIDGRAAQKFSLELAV